MLRKDIVEGRKNVSFKCPSTGRRGQYCRLGTDVVILSPVIVMEVICLCSVAMCEGLPMEWKIKGPRSSEGKVVGVEGSYTGLLQLGCQRAWILINGLLGQG